VAGTAAAAVQQLPHSCSKRPQVAKTCPLLRRERLEGQCSALQCWGWRLHCPSVTQLCSSTAVMAAGRCWGTCRPQYAGCGHAYCQTDSRSARQFRWCGQCCCWHCLLKKHATRTVREGQQGDPPGYSPCAAGGDGTIFGGGGGTLAGGDGDGGLGDGGLGGGALAVVVWAAARPASASAHPIISMMVLTRAARGGCWRRIAMARSETPGVGDLRACVAREASRHARCPLVSDMSLILYYCRRAIRLWWPRGSRPRCAVHVARATSQVACGPGFGPGRCGREQGPSIIILLQSRRLPCAAVPYSRPAGKIDQCREQPGYAGGREPPDQTT
jgi:hypothetical protein